MGAASSVIHVYHEGLSWFREYIDGATYLEDFKSIDKDADGGITFGELQKWILEKAKVEGGAWSVFLSNKQIISIAHKTASTYQDAKSTPAAGKVVDVGEFRALLVHLFAISILWKHFENADNWIEAGDDVGTKQLSRQQFAHACQTLCSAHAGEELTSEQIDEDFDLLDTNQSGTIGFIEVCNYCCRYIDPAQKEMEKIYENMPKKFFGDVVNCHTEELMKDLESGPKKYYNSYSVDEKTSRAMGVLDAKLNREVVKAQNFENAKSAQPSASPSASVVVGGESVACEVAEATPAAEGAEPVSTAEAVPTVEAAAAAVEVATTPSEVSPPPPPSTETAEATA